MAEIHCSQQTGNGILSVKNSKMRKKGLRAFTMTGTAVRPAEETLNQAQHVQDMGILFVLKTKTHSKQANQMEI